MALTLATPFSPANVTWSPTNPDSLHLRRSDGTKRGVFISRSTLAVRRAVLLSREREDALRRLADDYGTQAMEALGDLLTFSLDEDAAVARRILHVKRRAAA
jgi:hypothetical protein